MTDRPRTDDAPHDDDAITDTGTSLGPRITPMRLLLGAAVVIGLGATSVLTLGPPRIGDDIVLTEAFVRGAVSHIGTEENARILRLHVALGDAVATGDPLVDLSDDRLTAQRAVLEARISRIDADLRAARARDAIATERDSATVAAARLDRDAVAADLGQARAQVALLEERVARKEDLADDGHVAQATLSQEATQLIQARADVARLTARLASADLEIERAQAAAGSDVVRQAERDGIAARLAQAQAELAELEMRIAGRTLTALADGIVVDVPARPGASVGTDDPILSIWDPTRTWMLAWVDQDRMGRVRVGDTARIRIDSVSGTLEGQVQRVLVASDGRERTLPGQPVSPLLPDDSRFAVQIGFDARDMTDRILPGMSGSVTIVPGGETPAPTILSKLRARLATYP